MRKYFRPSVVVFGALAVLLTACSGSENGDDDIAGVDDAPHSEESSGEGGSSEGDEDGAEDDGVERPDIEVADTLDMVFEEVETGGPVEDRVIKDSEWQILSVYEVVTDHDAESSVSFYTAEDALLWDVEFLESVLERGLTSSGTMLFYNRDVTLVSEDTATVVYCRDFTDVETLDAETGEVTEEADPDALPTFYESFLRENEDGVWETVAREYEQESSRC